MKLTKFDITLTKENVAIAEKWQCFFFSFVNVFVHKYPSEAFMPHGKNIFLTVAPSIWQIYYKNDLTLHNTYTKLPHPCVQPHMKKTCAS